MKDVISVEEILDGLALNITIKKSDPLDEADEAHNKLYSLLISKLPEKMVRSEVFEGESDGTIEAYNSAIDDMHQVIDELFGVK